MLKALFLDTVPAAVNNKRKLLRRGAHLEIQIFFLFTGNSLFYSKMDADFLSESVLSFEMIREESTHSCSFVIMVARSNMMKLLCPQVDS